MTSTTGVCVPTAGCVPANITAGSNTAITNCTWAATGYTIPSGGGATTACSATGTACSGGCAAG